MPIITNHKSQVVVILGAGDVCCIQALAVEDPEGPPSITDSYFGFLSNAELVAELPVESKVEQDLQPDHEPDIIFHFANEDALHGLIYRLQSLRDDYFKQKLVHSSKNKRL